MKFGKLLLTKELAGYPAPENCMYPQDIIIIRPSFIKKLARQFLTKNKQSISTIDSHVSKII